MKGIILKDLYDNFCIPKNAAAYIFAGLLTIPVGFLVRSEYYYILFSMIILPLIGGCALEYPTEQEERANFTRLLATFPVSMAQIVTAKYILGLCSAAVCNLGSAAHMGRRDQHLPDLPLSHICRLFPSRQTVGNRLFHRRNNPDRCCIRSIHCSGRY